MGEAIIGRKAGGIKTVVKQDTKIFIENSEFVVPSTIIGNITGILVGGGGGTYSGSGGGGGGNINFFDIQANPKESISIVIGDGGNNSAGGTTFFGSYASATGGEAGTATGGNGGSGGGGATGIGGIGYTYGGGGGGGRSVTYDKNGTFTTSGGNGGMYGGGGGGGGSVGNRGSSNTIKPVSSGGIGGFNKAEFFICYINYNTDENGNYVWNNQQVLFNNYNEFNGGWHNETKWINVYSSNRACYNSYIIKGYGGNGGNSGSCFSSADLSTVMYQNPTNGEQGTPVEETNIYGEYYSSMNADGGIYGSNHSHRVSAGGGGGGGYGGYGGNGSGGMMLSTGMFHKCGGGGGGGGYYANGGDASETRQVSSQSSISLSGGTGGGGGGYGDDGSDGVGSSGGGGGGYGIRGYGHGGTDNNNGNRGICIIQYNYRDFE